MQARRWLSRLSFVGGVLVALVGILHSAATPMVYRGLSTIMPDRALGGAYCFGVMGLYVIFAGWLMIYSAGGLARGERWAWVMALVNGAWNSIAGIAALLVGFRNPLIFVWLFPALSVAILSGVLHASYRRGLLAPDGARAPRD